MKTGWIGLRNTQRLFNDFKKKGQENKETCKSFNEGRGSKKNRNAKSFENK